MFFGYSIFSAELHFCLKQQKCPKNGFSGMFLYLQVGGLVLRFLGYLFRPKNLVLMPKNAKQLICIFCPFLRAEMTSRHKNKRIWLWFLICRYLVQIKSIELFMATLMTNQMHDGNLSKSK